MDGKINPAKRDSLLRAANALVAEQGFAAATLRNVALRAGCTTGSVTHHFSGRQELLVAMLRAVHEAAAQRMSAHVGDTSEPRVRLRAVLLEALPLDDVRLAEWRVWLGFWSEAVSNPPIAEENALRYREWRALLDSLLEPLLARGSWRDSAVETLVALVDGLGLGLVVSAVSAQGEHRRRLSAIRAIDEQLNVLCAARRVP